MGSYDGKRVLKLEAEGERVEVMAVAMIFS